MKTIVINKYSIEIDNELQEFNSCSEIVKILGNKLKDKRLSLNIILTAEPLVVKYISIPKAIKQNDISSHINLFVRSQLEFKESQFDYIYNIITTSNKYIIAEVCILKSDILNILSEFSEKHPKITIKNISLSSLYYLNRCKEKLKYYDNKNFCLLLIRNQDSYNTIIYERTKSIINSSDVIEADHFTSVDDIILNSYINIVGMYNVTLTNQDIDKSILNELNNFFKYQYNKIEHSISTILVIDKDKDVFNSITNQLNSNESELIPIDKKISADNSYNFINTRIKSINKENNIRSYKIIGWVAAIFTLLILIVIQTLLFIDLNKDNITLTEKYKSLKQQTKNIIDEYSQLEVLDNKIKKTKEIQNNFFISKILSIIEYEIPDKIKIDRISLSTQKDKYFLIQGRSLDNDNILTFIKRLEKTNAFKNVVINLINQDENKKYIDFNITLVL